MKIKTKLLLVTIVAGSLSQSSFAGSSFGGADEPTQAICAQVRANVLAKKQAEYIANTPKPANEFFSTQTCLDSILNTRINIFTSGGLDSILGTIIDQAKNKACSVVMGSWNEAINKANQTIGANVSLPYAGNILGVNVGTGIGGQPVNINGGSLSQGAVFTAIDAQTSTKNTASTVNAAVNKTTSLGTLFFNIFR